MSLSVAEGRYVPPGFSWTWERTNCSLTVEGPTNWTLTLLIFGPIASCWDHPDWAQATNSQSVKKRKKNFIGYRPGISSSATLAALSNRVYGFKNVKFTSPVGPFRCLAINKFTGTPSPSSGASSSSLALGLYNKPTRSA